MDYDWKPTPKMKLVEKNGKEVLMQEWQGTSYQIGYGMQYTHEWRPVPVEKIPVKKR